MSRGLRQRTNTGDQSAMQDFMAVHSHSSATQQSAQQKEQQQQRSRRRSSVSETVKHALHSAAETAAEISESIVKMLTTTFEDAPAWMKDNPSIKSGYRRELRNYYECVKSLFYLHNEFVNIWSHLIGTGVFVVFASIAYNLIFREIPTVQWKDYAAFYVFLVGAMICLGLSSVFHTLSCHSQDINYHYNKLDYVGIVVLIVFSVYPAIYYGFYCSTNFQIFYVALITALGCATMVVALAQKFQAGQYRIFRTCIFISLGFSGVIPMAHAILMYGWDTANKAMAIKYMLLMGLLYVTGAVIYANRIPEKFWPGRFDIWGHSHQIFHGFVVAAAVTHFLAVWRMFNAWHGGDLHCQELF